jgi:hypothetical protein
MGTCTYLPSDDGHHPAGDAAVADQVDGDVGEGDRDHLVERIGLARAQVVGQLGVHRVLAGALLDLLGQREADVDLAPVAVGVGLAELAQRPALPRWRPRTR